jgi:hypothetical protein
MTKSSPFLLGSKPSTSTASFSPLFAPGTSCLFGSGHSLTHTSHPSGSMRLRRIKAFLCFELCLKHSPWSFSLDPRKSSVPLQRRASIPCSIGCITNLMVINQPLYDSRHRRVRIENNYRLIICGCSRYQSNLVDLYQPLSWLPAAPKLIF